MNNSEKVPDYIRKGAAGRIREKLNDQKEACYKIASKDRPMDAEEEKPRKIAYIKREVGVTDAIAEKIANYENLQALPISEEKKSKAESIQGSTMDFMGIYFADLCRAASRSVARVIFPDGSPQGTGFMISPELFITNNHVISTKEAAQSFQIEFNYETDFRKNLVASTKFALDPDKFFYTAPSDQLDFTVVAIGQRLSGNLSLSQIGFLPLLVSDDKHIKTMFVNCIQHPGGETKQLVVRENRLLARTETTLIYGSDTLPGSSGSPVFNDDWEVIALHHWGEPYKSMVDQPQGLPENGNEGIRISAIFKHLQTQSGSFSAEQLALLQKALNWNFREPSLITQQTMLSESEIKPPVQTPKKETMTTNPLVSAASGDGSLSFTIPLTISVKLGQPTPAATDMKMVPTDAVAEAATVRKFIPDPNYSNRKGYNPNFLGHKINLPRLTDQQKAAAARNLQAGQGENPFELKYQNFSVVMNGQRRIAFFTAVNIDGGSVVSINRDTGQVTKGPESFEAENAESGREKWFDDDRIADDQISEDNIYKNKLPQFHRGHLVKRTDPSWGTANKAFKGQCDTFHFTNCAPQHKNFNPSTSRWAGVENWITNTSDDENIRVSVFSGPVFGDDDPKVDYLLIPRLFWKVVAWVEDGKLLATAVIADQSDLIKNVGESLGGESFFDDLPNKLPADYHVTIKEVEKHSGLNFGNLKDHDILAAGGGESLNGGISPSPRRIYSFNDMMRYRRARIAQPEPETAEPVA